MRVRVTVMVPGCCEGQGYRHGARIATRPTVWCESRLRILFRIRAKVRARLMVRVRIGGLARKLNTYPLS